MTRVFISSTYIDNMHRRRLVEDAIATAGMVPVGLERFAAEDQPTVTAVEKLVGECDVLVGILAHRYGWTPPGLEQSITEIEHDIAEQCGIDRLIFIIDESVPVDIRRDLDPGEDRWEKQKNLQAFKNRLQGRLTARFREETLHGKVLFALKKWQYERKRTMPYPTPTETSDDLQLYYDKLATRHGQVSLVGFPGARIGFPIRLADLHVQIDAMVDRGLSHRVWSSAEHAVLGIEPGWCRKIPLSDTFKLSEKLGQRGVLLIGDPGSGKTTYLRWVLLQVIDRGPGSLGLPDDMVPVFLRLRNLRSRPAGLAAFIEQELKDPLGDLPEDLGHRLVREHRLLLMFDGLDDVANNEERAEAVRWIEDMYSSGQHRFLVSCRYAGYGDSVSFDRQNFLKLHVRPLNDEQTARFVHNWYSKVEAALDDDPHEAARLAEHGAHDLLETLRGSEFRVANVYAMTRNPLLLTGICLVHRDRGTLPTGRAQLYENCINVLLEFWRKEAKRLKVSVPAKEARKILQPVALWLHEQNGRTRATAEELREPIETVLTAQGTSEKTAHELLRSIRNESGLLTGWGDDSYGFMHLGFQEYLAACELRARALVNSREFDHLASKLAEPWWQEVILLALAMDGPAIFEPFMRAVIRRQDFTDRWCSEVMRFAMEEATGKAPGPFQELIEFGDDLPHLARRQAAAANLLRESMPDAFAKIHGVLSQHDNASVRALVETHRSTARERRGSESRSSKVISAPRGGYELVWIPGGRFLMGSPELEIKRMKFSKGLLELWKFPPEMHPEAPQHPIEIDGFYLGICPVTNNEYRQYLDANPGANKPESWGDRRFNQPDQPVVGISWNEAKAYCEWAGLTLPTEAQWEYACRAGSTTRYWFGDDESQLRHAAWYDEDYEKGQPHPVGQKVANPFGLHDLYGNVWEWCEDYFGPYEGRPSRSGDGLRQQLASDRDRVFRGGAWYSRASVLRSACRYGVRPGYRFRNVGFRAAKAPP
ncbi:MAG: SUMF1/EgtB/PvdO family nonheme iron enzyme [Myxococcota bacterium]